MHALPFVVLVAFTAFRRDYRVGHEITERDIADHWLPAEHGANKVHELLQRGWIAPKLPVPDLHGEWPSKME